MPTPGESLKELRRIRRQTQTQLAEALKVSRLTVTRWENGKTILGAEDIMQLAKHFNVSTDRILYGKNENQAMKLLQEIGLSEEAIIVLASNGEISECINLLLKSSNGLSFLSDVLKYIKYSGYYEAMIETAKHGAGIDNLNLDIDPKGWFGYETARKLIKNLDKIIEGRKDNE